MRARGERYQWAARMGCKRIDRGERVEREKGPARQTNEKRRKEEIRRK